MCRAFLAQALQQINNAWKREAAEVGGLQTALKMGEIEIEEGRDFLGWMFTAHMLEHIHCDRRIRGAGELQCWQSITLNAEVLLCGIENCRTASAIAVNECAVDVEE